MTAQTLKKIFWILFVTVFMAALGLMLYMSSKYRLVSDSYTKPVRSVDAVWCETNGREKDLMRIPGQTEALPPQTLVVLTFDIETNPNESLLFYSYFSPVKLYFNDRLVYEFGQVGTYPAYMVEPPAFLSMIPFPDEGGVVAVRVEMVSLTQRGRLTIPAIYAGEETAMLVKQYQMNGPTFFFAALLMFLGLMLMIISLTFIKKAPANTTFLWLGLFSLASGAWVMGECGLSPFLIPYPAFLYALNYLGLFLLAIPLLLFGMAMLKPQNELPLKIMLTIHIAALLAALLLQLSKTMDFIKTLYLFHVITPMAFMVLTCDILWEHFKYHNPAAKRFAPALSLLALSAVLEALNYYFHFIPYLTVFFQLGVLIFVVALSIISGLYLQESMRAVEDKRRLEYEMAAMNRQMEQQRLYYGQLAENDSQIKAQRHDLRHQLAAVRALSGDKEKLESFVDTLLRKIPKDRGNLFCDSYAVHAVASYYYEIAKEKGIDIDLSFVMPSDMDAALESDVCIVVGNFLENAVEGCLRGDSTNAFIRLNSIVHDSKLIFTMDNSFNGQLSTEGERLLSSKRNGAGIGTQSVMAVAKKYNGNARFEAVGDVFQSSAYLVVR